MSRKTVVMSSEDKWLEVEYEKTFRDRMEDFHPVENDILIADFCRLFSLSEDLRQELRERDW